MSKNHANAGDYPGAMEARGVPKTCGYRHRIKDWGSCRGLVRQREGQTLQRDHVDELQDAPWQDPKTAWLIFACEHHHNCKTQEAKAKRRAAKEGRMAEPVTRLPKAPTGGKKGATRATTAKKSGGWRNRLATTAGLAVLALIGASYWFNVTGPALGALDAVLAWLPLALVCAALFLAARYGRRAYRRLMRKRDEERADWLLAQAAGIARKMQCAPDAVRIEPRGRRAWTRDGLCVRGRVTYPAHVLDDDPKVRMAVEAHWRHKLGLPGDALAIGWSPGLNRFDYRRPAQMAAPGLPAEPDVQEPEDTAAEHAETMDNLQESLRQRFKAPTLTVEVVSRAADTSPTALRIDYGLNFADSRDTARLEFLKAVQAKTDVRWRPDWNMPRNRLMLTRRPEMPAFVENPTADPKHPAFYRNGKPFRFPLGVGEHGEVIYWDIYDAPHALIAGGTGGGKALALDTPIPTPTGWTTMGALRDGDLVFDENGTPCRVVKAHDVMHGRPCYEVVFSDGTTIVADAEHLWATWDLRTRKAYDHANPGTSRYPDDWATWSPARSGVRSYPAGERTQMRALRQSGLTAHEIGVQLGRSATAIQQQWSRPELDSKAVAPRTTEELAATLRAHGQRNHAIPAAKPLHLPEAELPIDPYVLGYLLGDGDSAGTGRVACDPQDRDWLITEFRAAGYEANTLADPGHFGVRGIRPAWRALGLSSKHIPSAYQRASVQQRLALAQGLIDSDGCVDNHGAYRLTTTSWALAEGFRDLVATLGCVPQVHARPSRIRAGNKGLPAWEVIVPTDMALARLLRKALAARRSWKREQFSRYIVDVRPVESVPVRCITVDSPSRLYLASQACIPTHNTVLLHALVWWASIMGWDIVLIDPKGTGLGGLRDLPGVIAYALADPEEINRVLTWAEREMRGRYRQVLDEGADYTKFRRCLIVVDEYADLVTLLRQWHKALGEKGDPTGLSAVTAIPRLGRECNVLEVVGIQQAAAKYFDGTDTKDNYGLRVGLGPQSDEAADMLFDRRDAGRDVPQDAKGRATIALKQGEPQEMQVFWTPTLMPNGKVKPRRQEDAEPHPDDVAAIARLCAVVASLPRQRPAAEVPPPEEPTPPPEEPARPTRTRTRKRAQTEGVRALRLAVMCNTPRWVMEDGERLCAVLVEPDETAADHWSVTFEDESGQRRDTVSFPESALFDLAEQQ